MASLSESRNMTLEDAEVTSEHRGPEPIRRQLIPLEDRDPVAATDLDLEFPLMRQNTIYSLTLDEIQNAVCEPGKTFGSMNMDEFLTNIWNVEEIQAAAAANNNNEVPINHLAESTAGRQAAEAAPLRRQGSLTLPAPLSRKTVDEVWAEIHRDAALRSQHVERASQEGAGSAPRQPTFGEMTLEDFLIKAGVVREGYGGGPPGAPSPHQQPVVPPPAPAAQQYGMAGFGHVVGVAGYVDEQGLGSAAGVGNGGYSVGNGFGGRVGNGYAASAAVRSPASPVSSEGIGGGQVDNTVAGYVVDGPRVGGGGGGRKRPTDGAAVDKVVERRQRRMIKNRESAARSRARKQAYTVELEAELNQLKEENGRLREEQVLESMSEQARINVQKAARKLRRCSSSTW
ncbi:Basic region leucine zipper [Musa troglodytarum]|uniref:Basic region leucine zipper n=1 Tax=Musa troglodytarum TaxID=320322 RepID=A0A9E7HQS6_9LILI|nr:Basic region leucine zipper [Musa troglodytarum]URE38235.1 Basic region leucine zipper [Musa troglodytarum]URE38236.1 Basic region leucine zipper [Musa troglodytarum]URE38239.1 Basic region leucine zipper [Musa troglodytarum]URE38240.1 Basic region leucine zipper [Musa troglodytarum]